MVRRPPRRPIARAVLVVVALTVTACADDGRPIAQARSAPTRASDPSVTTAGGPAGGPGPSVSDVASTEGTTTTTAPPDVAITLAFGGDILTHMPVNASAAAAGGGAHDFAPLLDGLAPVVGGVDLALCHLEVPIAGDGQAITGYPSFHAPPEVIDGIAAVGYDGCSTASNHSLDAGMTGLVATLDRFDRVGLGHVGTARSAEEGAAPRIYDVGGQRIAHLSYSYGFNGYQLPADAPWAADLIDPDRIAADAAAARAAGAQLVVVSVHWGTEYRHDPDAQQEAWADAITAGADVDLVIGHHAHVVQPIEQVNGTWVVYGLGNQLSNQAEAPRRDGLTVVVRVGGPPGGPLSVTGIEAVPTWVVLDGHRVIPTVPSLRREGTEASGDLDASLARTMEVVNARGANVPVYAG